MKRNVQQRNDTEAVGSDSFIDVVCNMVGILVILVMVVGIRIKHAPVEAAPTAAASTFDVKELDSARLVEASLTSEIHQLDAHVRATKFETALAGERRVGLATLLAARRQSASDRAGEEASRSQDAAKLRRQADDARAELARVESKIKTARSRPAATITVKSYPTPLSQTVLGHESHFVLQGGRISPIPLDGLIEELKTSAGRQVRRLENQDEVTDSVGPIAGFRLRYRMERVNLPIETPLGTLSGGSFAQLAEWQLDPVADDLGEPLDEALSEGSDYRRTLALLKPGRTTITLWVYPDSFDAFRAIREDLYNLRFAVAGRPLPQGLPIGGSPEGSKSAAQ